MNLYYENYERLVLDLQKYLKQNYKPDAVGDSNTEIYLDKNLNVSEEIQKLLENMDISFADKLLEIIKENNFSEVEVYKKAGIDRKYFEKIRNKKRTKIERVTIILLCLSLELSYEEAVDLYQRAGYAFSGCLKIDVIGKFFLENKIYDVFKFRDILYEFALLKDD